MRGIADDEFEVRLRRIDNRKARRVRRPLRSAAEKEVGTVGRRASSFYGGRIGRRYAQGTVLAARARAKGLRRIVIKARVACEWNVRGAALALAAVSR
ncbi:hypothetical protein ACVIHI_003427 [Bradyrhizobium sp. USDA 4524]|uniref:hypothetical protein n=1 Tax=unclassified Bradyrhizobium TaxID=2631580 RepID=UPI00209ECABE|nr:MULTISPECIES: hypothetical protein [unclassified Bradyrhizobium]MCP1843654.1 hypothetical protein [Bradyrhizobium sp. USDA 4538]MCP1904220.1 hypothetical protein [Bradyrhizobium sp. USDA 4537]MCP1990124.1 hypothetical protein [Bradyrhizobium sp. USDA 4539]